MISIVVPVYNEENAIAKMLADLSRAMQGNFKDYEIIIVNDGSTDRTLEIIEKEKNEAMSVLTHPENMGYGKSLLDGIEAAKYECVAIIDADGSYSPEDINSLYAYYPQYDMVVGARQGREYRKGLFKKSARILFQYLAEYASGRKVVDVNSGLRIFKRSILLGFKDSLCIGFSFTTTCTLFFLLNHYYVKFLPVSYAKREGQSKIRYLRDTLRAGQIIIEVILYYNPVKLFLLIAIWNLIFGLAIGIINYFFLRSSFFSVCAAICVANTALIFCCGLIADQLRNIYKINKWHK